MAEKAKAVAAPEKTTGLLGRASPSGLQASQKISRPLAGFQETLGNQAMLQLLESGGLQTKLRVSQPGDADEIEADRVADQIVSRQHAPALQRKCSCDGGGTPCAKCAGEDEEKIHRSVAAPMLRASESLIQRAPADPSAAPAQAAPGAQAETPAERSKPPAQVIVEDEAKTVAPHQMRKSQFLALLRADACATSDAVLMSVGHSTKSCPYIEKWFSFYEKQSGQHIEQALHKYAPETAGARNAHEAIRMAVKRVQRAALTWAKTGKVEGVPKELAGQVPGGGILGGKQSAASSGVGGAILGFFGGQKTKNNSAREVMRKAKNGEHAPPHDAAAVKSQLASGHSLDSRVQSQMCSAFGHDFSGVRIHTDSRAASLSSDLQARAFTIGSDVAFASGEYRPGTLVGDALIAHELAHVVQQAGSQPSAAPMLQGGNDYNALEQDADRSAVSAVAAMWQTHGGTPIKATPRLRSGLQLHRCSKDSSKAASGSAKTGLSKGTISGGVTGLTLAATATYSDCSDCTDGLEAMQVFWGTRRTDGVQVGKVQTTFPPSPTSYDSFVDGGKNSPGGAVYSGDHPYYIGRADLPASYGYTAGQGSAGSVSGCTANISDVPGAARLHVLAFFETAVVCLNYLGKGKDKLLDAFKWGFINLGRTYKPSPTSSATSGLEVSGSPSGKFQETLKADYPGYLHD